MQTFLNSIDIPTIDILTQILLDQPITLEEIYSSIKEINNGKAPGPDGFLCEFYKKFSEQLAPLLLQMFEHSLSSGTLPNTLTEATISVITKKDKNPAECSSYRPILSDSSRLLLWTFSSTAAEFMSIWTETDDNV